MERKESLVVKADGSFFRKLDFKKFVFVDIKTFFMIKS